MEDILIKCEGRNFVKDKAVCDRIMTLGDILDLCENLYHEVDKLTEELQDLEENLQENYTPKNKAEQYAINDSDFI